MLTLNDRKYLHARGLDVQLGLDNYPEGHQSGLTVILRDQRIISNGDIRLEACPGQFQAVPKCLETSQEEGRLSMRSSYPDPAKNRRGFNPVLYPPLDFSYRIEVTACPSRKAEGQGPAASIHAFELSVILDEALPDSALGEGRAAEGAGFNIELFPGYFMGRGWYMEGSNESSGFAGSSSSGIFPLQANGPIAKQDGLCSSLTRPADSWPGAETSPRLLAPLGRGKILRTSPESPELFFSLESLEGGELELHDGRAVHTNGWFILRSALPAGKKGLVLRWRFELRVEDDWIRSPVIQVNQAGFHPRAPKRAVIEFDVNDPRSSSSLPIKLIRIGSDGYERTVMEGGTDFGNFLRYRYRVFDFSSVEEPGLYRILSCGLCSSLFRIDHSVYERHVWQPVLERFLPVQMCHMRVEDGYRVWHGACHLDDALMAPVDTNHFDGYSQGPSTLCQYKSGDSIPGLNEGGWHDAGDFDLRIESQAGTVYGLSLVQEYFSPDWDSTTVDRQEKTVRILSPDGIPDILQQIEHGLLTILGAWRSLGRLYRGIIEENLRDYVLIGDPLNNRHPRLVFTEDNPSRELETAAALACAYRAIRGYREDLALEALDCARELWRRASKREETRPDFRLVAAAELFLSLESAGELGELARVLLSFTLNDEFFIWIAPALARSRAKLQAYCDASGDASLASAFEGFNTRLEQSARKAAENIKTLMNENPYGLPYRPHVWGAGWGIQGFGSRIWILSQEFPDIFDQEAVHRAFDFVLGCHPGSNRASFISGVGTESITTAYGLNRADWSYIPGGSVSGTGLIGPDFPELLDWPYLWQQTEYVLGGGTTDWLFLALAIREKYRA